MIFYAMRYCLICLLLLCLFSCKPGAPSGVLSEGKMENVLYDYHLAQGLAEQASPDSFAFYEQLYRESVFAKYDIDAATFDRSLVWYTRHTDKLKKIYMRLAERMGDNENGEVTSQRLASGAQSASGDSLNMWHGLDFALLHSQGMNRLTFTERADTAVHQGDLLVWHFRADWHYHEGVREAVALLVVHYEGDSVAVQQKNFFVPGLQSVQTTIANRKVLKIQGFVYQNASWSDRPKLLVLSDFSLLRVRRGNLLQESELRIQPDIKSRAPMLRDTANSKGLILHDTLPTRRIQRR